MILIFDDLNETKNCNVGLAYIDYRAKLSACKFNNEQNEIESSLPRTEMITNNLLRRKT